MVILTFSVVHLSLIHFFTFDLQFLCYFKHKGHGIYWMEWLQGGHVCSYDFIWHWPLYNGLLVKLGNFKKIIYRSPIFGVWNEYYVRLTCLSDRILLTFTSLLWFVNKLIIDTAMSNFYCFEYFSYTFSNRSTYFVYDECMVLDRVRLTLT